MEVNITKRAILTLTQAGLIYLDAVNNCRFNHSRSNPLQTLKECIGNTENSLCDNQSEMEVHEAGRDKDQNLIYMRYSIINKCGEDLWFGQHATDELLFVSNNHCVGNTKRELTKIYIKLNICPPSPF